MQILLQNRTRFYEVLLPRIPDPIIRERLNQISRDGFLSSSQKVTLDKSNINIEKLLLLDPLCKPELGSRWGQTSISLEESLTRASRLEELILLVGKAHLEANPDPTAAAIVEIAQRRYASLLSLIDDLRYHRIRLVEMP